METSASECMVCSWFGRDALDQALVISRDADPRVCGWEELWKRDVMELAMFDESLDDERPQAGGKDQRMMQSSTTSWIPHNKNIGCDMVLNPWKKASKCLFISV
jgi:hypothetical protein